MPAKRLDVEMYNEPTLDVRVFKSQYNVSFGPFTRLRRYTLRSALIKHINLSTQCVLLVNVDT